jgi:hypothetical protein
MSSWRLGRRGVEPSRVWIFAETEEGRTWIGVRPSIYIVPSRLNLGFSFVVVFPYYFQKIKWGNLSTNEVNVPWCAHRIASTECPRWLFQRSDRKFKNLNQKQC